MSSRLRKGKKSALNLAIEKWWNRKAEVKMVYSAPVNTLGGSILNGQNFTSAISVAATSGIFPLLPVITQGTTALTRVGDYIQPRKLVVDFRASLLEPFDVDSHFGSEIWPEDIMVHVFFLTSKTVKSYVQGAPIGFGLTTEVNSKLMGFNGIQVSGFDGTVVNSDKPVNTELFTVIKRMKFRLNRSSGFKSLVQLNGASAPAPPTTVPLISVGGQDSKHFKVTIPLPKRLQFENTGNTCSNHFPFMVAGWTYTHSPLNQTTSTLAPLSIQANTQLYYTDD